MTFTHAIGISNQAADAGGGDRAGKLYDELWTKHRIIHQPDEVGGVEGIRVTPNVYITLDEIDRFVEAMDAILRRSASA